MLHTNVHGTKLTAYTPDEMKYLLTTYIHGFDSPIESRFETEQEAVESIPDNARVSLLSEIKAIITE